MGKAGRWVMAVRLGRWVRLVVTGNGSTRGKVRRWVRLVVTGNGSTRGKVRRWVRLVVTGNGSTRGKVRRWVRLVVTGNGSKEGTLRRKSRFCQSPLTNHLPWLTLPAGPAKERKSNSMITCQPTTCQHGLRERKSHIESPHYLSCTE